MESKTDSNELKKSKREKAKKWIDEKLMKKMDKYAFTRGLLLFALFAFFLGNNLGIFLWLHVITTLYLVIYRYARFWVKRWLMYMAEFCYFGNFIGLAYIVFYGSSIEIFSIAYVCSTGVMALAVIAFNNQAQFNSTDHLTSTYIHALPLVTFWAIRWRHRIYYLTETAKWGITLGSLEHISFALDDTFYNLVKLPILFWLCWAAAYFILTATVLRQFVYSEVYGSGITDFVKQKTPLTALLGDVTKWRQLKYLIQHFVFFIVAIPLSVLSFYSFEFNCVYVFSIILFISWNTGRNNWKQIQKRLEKNEVIAEKETTKEN
jgi:hypothetical protein